MKTLPPQHLKPRYYDPIESQIVALFYSLLFKPLVDVINETNAQLTTSSLLNAPADGGALRAALHSGRIQYEAGIFSGEFSAAISRDLRSFGAKWYPSQKLYKCDPSLVPGWVKVEAAGYQATARGAHDTLQKRLTDMQQDLDRALAASTIRAGQTLREIQHDFKDAATVLEIKPELSEDSLTRLAADYNENMKLYIKTFSEEMIQDLRATVAGNAEQGYRFDSLIDEIKKRYSVSQAKAKFLSRQETSLYMSKYRRERFSEAGVSKYKWSTSHDERVRSSHKHLDGQVFAYAHPPVTDLATGAKNNPGEDFNCRCVDLPVLDKAVALA